MPDGPLGAWRAAWRIALDGLGDHGLGDHGGIIRRVGVVAAGGGEVAAGGVGHCAALEERQVFAHFGGGLVAVRRVFRHGGEDDAVQVDGLVGGQFAVGGDALARRDGVFLDVLVGDGEGGFAFEWWFAGDGFVHDAAEGVDVGAGVGSFAACLLGGEVLRGADDCGGLRHGGGGVIQCAGDAEVHHLHLAGVGDHDVGGFDVAVDDAGVVAGLERVRDGQQERGGLLGA